MDPKLSRKRSYSDTLIHQVRGRGSQSSNAGLLYSSLTSSSQSPPTPQPTQPEEPTKSPGPQKLINLDKVRLQTFEEIFIARPPQFLSPILSAEEKVSANTPSSASKASHSQKINLEKVPMHKFEETKPRTLTPPCEKSLPVVEKYPLELPFLVTTVCENSGFGPSFVMQHLDIIFKVGKFIYPEQFTTMKRTAGRIKNNCPPDRIEKGLQMFEATYQPVDKIFKTMIPVGSGGYGNVFTGKTKHLPSSISKKINKDAKYVAVKVVAHDTAVQKRRNLDEIGFLTTFRHANIVEFYFALHVFKTENKELSEKVYLITEFLEGGTIEDACVDHQLWSDGSVAFVAWKLLSALDYLHSKNFAHRDLKPANIMLSINADVKLIDLGLCCHFFEGKRTEMVGTSHWIPPEMIKTLPYDTKVDVWSLGVTMLEFYLHGPPHASSEFKSMVLTATEGLAGQIPTDHKLLRTSGRDFLKHCLTFDPDQRPSVKALLKHKWIIKKARRDHGKIKETLRQIFIQSSLKKSHLL